METKIDIGRLDRHQLRELRDEIDFEIQLHDAELRAFYGTALARPNPDDDWWCPVCEDREGDLDNALDSVRAAFELLTSDKDVAVKIEGAAAALEVLL